VFDYNESIIDLLFQVPSIIKDQHCCALSGTRSDGLEDNQL
jgi:hypothetical protein